MKLLTDFKRRIAIANEKRRYLSAQDKDIKKIYRDDEAGVILIEGDATSNIQTRKNETQEKVSEFYALVPFDKYDLDDLLQPYKKHVRKCDGKLREKYSAEHIYNK